MIYPNFKSPRRIKQYLNRSVGILLLMAFLLSACSTATPPPPTATPVVIDLNQLYANSWVLVGYGDPNNPTVIQPGLTLTAQFAPDGSMGGFGGCNNFSGAYQASTDGTMSVGPMATTMMACADGMEQETAYLAALQGAKSFSFNSAGRLEIKYDAGTGTDQLMTFAVAAMPLTGTNWILVSMGGASAQEPIADGVVVTATFSQDGTLSGSSGCNQYSATYTVTNDQITISQAASTMMACATGMEVEQAYLQALSTAQTFAITGPKLTITYNQGADVLTFTSSNLPLTYTVWSLTSMNGQFPPPESNITAMFTPSADSPDSGAITGFSGCNNYNAGYTISGSNLTVQPAAMTMMACAEGSDIESTYLELLQQSTSYQILADRLVLSGPSGSLVYTANRTPLTGALWTLVSLGNVDTPVFPVAGSRFAAQFIRIPGAPSGILSGSTGCNEYSAAYAASLEEIKINPPASTDNKTCAPGLTDQEQLYYLALSDATTYTISGNTLIMPYDDGKQRLIFEGTQVESATRPPLSSLNNTTWYLWFMNGVPLLPGTSIQGVFAINSAGTGGTLSGSAGCNNYVATFGDNLGMQTTVNATQRCTQPAGIMDQEASYIQALSRAFGYWQTGDQLIINSGQGVLTYHNTPVPTASDQTHLLVGPMWFLVSYGNQASVPGTQEPFTQFNSNGTLNGFTGCNTFQGNFTTNVQHITITNLNSTKTACTNTTLTNQEQAMLAILNSARDYQVVDTVMQIVGTAGVLNYSLTALNRPQENLPPTASFTFTPNVPAGQIVTFDGSSSTGPVPIILWEWDFGDKMTGTGTIIRHVYAQPGTYRVRLRVTDQRGQQGVQEQTVDSITPIQPTAIPTQTPTASPTPDPVQPTPTQAPVQPTPTLVPTQLPTLPPQASITGPSSGYVGDLITFDASGSSSVSSSIVTYDFNFGDGSSTGPVNSARESTIYNQPGNYTVSVIVTDQNGMSSQASTTIAISSKPSLPTNWDLSTINNGGLEAGTEISLQFQGGKLSGFAGCNSYTGGFTASDTGNGTYAVTVTGLTSTQSICSDDVMTQEQTYLTMVQSATQATFTSAGLTLNTAQGTLQYLPAPTPK